MDFGIAVLMLMFFTRALSYSNGGYVTPIRLVSKSRILKLRYFSSNSPDTNDVKPGMLCK